MADDLYHRYAHLRRLVKYGLKYFCAGKKTHLLLACTPKSGSTFLWTILSQLPEFQKVSLIPGADLRENEPCKEKLIASHHLNYMARLHVRYSLHTQELIEDFNLRPIVLVRDIYDSVVSLKDHIHDQRPFLSMSVWSVEEFRKWDTARQDEFVVDMAIPWYIGFFVSWLQCQDKTVLTYEELSRDTMGTVKRLFDELKIPASNEEITGYLDKASRADTLKNEAVIGRGSALSPKLKDRVKRFASYYPNVDFTPLGIQL